jgi:hypothetical protein
MKIPRALLRKAKGAPAVRVLRLRASRSAQDDIGGGMNCRDRHGASGERLISDKMKSPSTHWGFSFAPDGQSAAGGIVFASYCGYSAAASSPFTVTLM